MFNGLSLSCDFYLTYEPPGTTCDFECHIETTTLRRRDTRKGSDQAGGGVSGGAGLNCEQVNHLMDLLHVHKLPTRQGGTGKSDGEKERERERDSLLHLFFLHFFSSVLY